MTDAAPFSPPWWLDKLDRKLSERAATFRVFEEYYEGRQPLAFATAQYRIEFARLLMELCDNWMAPVIDIPAERMNVEGIRMAVDDQEADVDAWRIWQENSLDADSLLAHSTAMITGKCPVLVWAGADGRPKITVEHPSEMIVAYQPGDRRTPRAALKHWRDDWEDEFAELYLPDGVYRFAKDGSGWKEPTKAPNPFGLVPVVDLVNNPRLKDGAGRSDLFTVISTQDQINKLRADMIIAAEFAAFRQRWVTGIELEVDPETGREKKPFESAVSRMLTVADPSVTFGEFGQTDLGNYTKAIESLVQSLASRTRTPPHYLLGTSGVMANGESTRASETGLITKVRARCRGFGESWEQVFRLGFAVLDDDRKDAPQAEVIWGDPETHSESEHVDAVMKKMALHVPVQQLWEDLGYSPQQIAGFQQMLLEEALNQALAAPLAPVTVAPPVTPTVPANAGV